MMFNLSKIIIDGCLLSIVASLWLILIMRINPRIFLQDYPKDIQAAVHPKTPSEKKLTLWLGIPFLLLLILFPFFSTLGLKQQTGSYAALLANAFGVAFIFNLVDWLLLDWLMFCTLTPKFLIIPGTAGMAGYNDYMFHFRGFIIGTILSAIIGAVLAGVVLLIG
jgi:hypothetical protein